MSKPDAKSGSCLCGKVGYTVIGSLRQVSVCHCSQCRKQTGSFYMATAADDVDLSIADPEDMLSWYEASDTAKRGFCRNCGSALFWKHNEEDKTSILAGTLNGPTGLEVERHIFVGSKGDFYEIADGKPQFKTF